VDRADFVDSGWMAGTTGAGFDDGGMYSSVLGLDLSAMKGVNSTAYVRVPFTLEDVATCPRSS